MSTEQAYTYEANVLKGYYPGYALDRQIEFAAGTSAHRGTVWTLDPSTKQGVVGLNLNAVGLIALKSTSEEDVQALDQLPVIVVTGGFEVESTQYVDDTYMVNDPLTAGEQGDADEGLLKKGEYYADAIVGIVSDPPGAAINQYPITTIKFFTYWLPKTGLSSSVAAPVGE
jgi:hypothetical protein